VQSPNEKGCGKCDDNAYQLTISENWDDWKCFLKNQNPSLRLKNCWAAFPPINGDLIHCNICDSGFILGLDYACYKQN
jgi:hypothetical protein